VSVAASLALDAMHLGSGAIALARIAAKVRQLDVARVVNPTCGQRQDVIERART